MDNNMLQRNNEKQFKRWIVEYNFSICNHLSKYEYQCFQFNAHAEKYFEDFPFK